MPTVPADEGYARKKLIERFEADANAPELYLAISGDDHDLSRHDYRPSQNRKHAKFPTRFCCGCSRRYEATRYEGSTENANRR